jgi:hypothetical protein
VLVKLFDFFRIYALHFNEQILSKNAEPGDFRSQRVMRRKPLFEFYNSNVGSGHERILQAHEQKGLSDTFLKARWCFCSFILPFESNLLGFLQPFWLVMRCRISVLA